jgi:hypothetical protein
MAHATAIDERLLSAELGYYVWSFPGSPIKVHLALEVVKGMQAQLRDGGANAAGSGLLLGGISGQTTVVSGFQPLARGDAEEIEQAIVALEKAPGRHSLVGYYRTHREDGLRLDESDLSLAGAFFRNPHHVFLLIQPVDSGPANASFFFWDGGRMTGDFPFLEFPLDPALLANAERHRAEAMQLRALDIRTEHAPAPRPLPRSRAPRRVLKGAAWVLLAASLALAAVTGVMRFPQAFAHLINRRSPVAAASTQPSPPSMQPEQSSMGFEVTRQSGDLKVTWKRDSAVIRSATSGVLSIQDGNGIREFQLLAEQVKGGSILYSPVSDQVQVQLTVSTPAGTATESVMVINPRVGQPKVQPVKSPQPPPSDNASRSASLKTFTPSLAAFPAPKTSVVLDAPPTLAPSPNPGVAEPGSLLNRGPLAVLPPVVRRPPGQTPAGPTVSVAPIYYAPEAIQTARPNLSPSARFVLIRTPKTVGISVSLDDRGKVVKASALPDTDAQQPLVDAALDAARESKFRPARRGDQPVSSEMVLRFEFKPGR